MYCPDDTIAALASASGGAARGIVRISGADTARVLARCVQAADGGIWRRTTEPTAIDGTIELARGIAPFPLTVLFWPGHRSYTRQPAAEVHAIGSPPLLSRIVDALCTAGARLAEPGEFTLRAFLAGRLDLTQAEAVLGVIDARGEDDLRQALAQLAGGLARPLHRLREELLELLAHLEAGLDFVEEDIEFVSREALREQLNSAATLLASTTAQLVSRRHSETLPTVVLVGYPNVGKSSLFNVLLGNSAALVSNKAGTTRDYLAAPLKLGPVDCQLIDTAGRATVGPTESICSDAQSLSSGVASTAALELFCLDSTRPLNAWEVARLQSSSPSPRLVVATKCDRQGGATLVSDASWRQSAVETSAASGAGLDTLREAIAAMLGDFGSGGDAATAWTAERCLGSLRAAAEAIDAALSHCEPGRGEELVAAEIRLALTELGKVVGAVYTDEILDRVFSRFCIGK